MGLPPYDMGGGEMLWLGVSEVMEVPPPTLEVPPTLSSS